MNDVLGYVSQCELCGQRAITLAPHGSDWVCPRCAEVTEPSPYNDGLSARLHRNVAATELFPQHQRHTDEFLDGAGNLAMTSRVTHAYDTPPRAIQFDDDDDGPDLRKIQG